MISHVIPRPVMIKQIVIGIIQTLLIVLFTYAALSKLLDYETFKFQLGRSPYVTETAGLVAWALPVGELAIALTLTIRRTMLLGFYASFFLMFLFSGYIYAMLHYAFYVPCSCGGILSQMSWEQHFIFNIAFAFLALLGILLHISQTKNN
jgi:hypothetical protein